MNFGAIKYDEVKINPFLLTTSLHQQLPNPWISRQQLRRAFEKIPRMWIAGPSLRNMWEQQKNMDVVQHSWRSLTAINMSKNARRISTIHSHRGTNGS